MTDFRALCAELADELDAETGYTRNDGARITHPTVTEARAALAQPEPQGPGPTDEDLLDMWMEQYGIGPAMMSHVEFRHAIRDVLARWGRPAKPEVQGPTEAQLKTFACEWWHSFGFAKDKATCTWVIDHVAPEHFADFSRDVLARWSCPTTEPVPVAERLPGPKDCDAEGRCWLLYRSASMNRTPTWSLVHRRSIFDADYTNWLPHWALPVPQQEAQP